MTLTLQLVLGAALAATPTRFADLFSALEFRYAGSQYPRDTFHYRLFVPRRLEPTQRYPLMVWLHGVGHEGGDNVKQLAHLECVLDDPSNLDKFRFFILAVQCARGEPRWFHAPRAAEPAGEACEDMLDVTAAILRKTMREYPVDEDRVYLAGVSSGGTACWEMAMRWPDRFAAVVPMASRGGDHSRAAKLASIPVWAFHNADDEASPADAEEMSAAVARAGGNVHLTLLPSGGHDCWTAAFCEYDVMEWMLDQRRGALICWTPPGCRPWRWWHALTVPGLLAAAYATWRWGLRRRRRATGGTAAAEIPGYTAMSS
jgi:predicted peptidase